MSAGGKAAWMARALAAFRVQEDERVMAAAELAAWAIAFVGFVAALELIAAVLGLFLRLVMVP